VTKNIDEINALLQKNDQIIGLLRHLLAIELFKSGVSQELIGKHLHVAKASVVKMVQGIKRFEQGI